MKLEKTPEISYSEVSHVELAEISDYVSKLVTAGVITPNAETETYLRGLAGLPIVEETL
jgi:hypothetical protein